MYLITLFRPIAVFCGIDSIMRNIPHIQHEYAMGLNNVMLLQHINWKLGP